jgi:hypothetical protein
MAITDWSIYVENGNLQVFTEQDSGEIIAGSGSLAMEYTNSMLYSHANLVPNDLGASPLPKGVAPSGRLRTICQVDTHDGVAPQTSYFGLAAMQDQDDLSTSGSCYSLLVASDEGLANPTLHLHKFTSGLTDGLTVLSLVSIPFPGTITLGIPFTLELDWVVDIPNLNGVLLIGRTGTAINFSDLTGQISFVDTLSPLTSSVSEGIVASFKNNLVSSTKRVLFDNTTLFELV